MRCVAGSSAIVRARFCVATVWTTEGGFGSGVYDPMEGSVYLEAVVCDVCLVQKKALIARPLRIRLA